MAAKKTKSIKVKAKTRSGRAKTKRKIILNTPAKPQPSARKVTARIPRKRNALGAERVARITPKDIPEADEVAKPRRVAISKTLYENTPEEFDAPWVIAYRDEPSEEDTSRNRGQMLLAIMVATLMLGVFNSSALVNWVRGLPAGPVEDGIISSSETWHGWMEDRGLDEYMAGMQKYVETLKQDRW
jgi:hypothetical protein